MWKEKSISNDFRSTPSFATPPNEILQPTPYCQQRAAHTDSAPAHTTFYLLDLLSLTQIPNESADRQTLSSSGGEQNKSSHSLSKHVLYVYAQRRVQQRHRLYFLVSVQLHYLITRFIPCCRFTRAKTNTIFKKMIRQRSIAKLKATGRREDFTHTCRRHLRRMRRFGICRCCHYWRR